MYFVYYNDDAFKELAEAIHEALQDKNITSYLITKAQPEQAEDPNHLYIILGLNNEIPFLPKKYIAYQLEQSGNENQNHWFTHQYLKKLAGAIEIWDYSLKNIQNLKSLAKKYNFPKIKYVPMRYQPILTRTRALPNSEHKPYDVLFFGSKCPRRDHIIQEIRNRKIKVHYAENSLWGEERDRLVSESKIVLNIHYYENPILETSRLTYLLANQAFVISEPSQDKLLDKYYQNMVVFSDYEDIPQQCQNYLEHQDMTTKFAKQAHNNFIKQKYDLPLETVHSFKTMNPPLLINQPNQEQNQLPNKEQNQLPDQEQNQLPQSKERKGIIRNLFKKADTKITSEGETLILDQNLSEDQLPNVSFVTPTANRHWALTTIALRSFYQMIYPRNKMEWVILDDQHDDKTFYLPQDKRIRYYQCPKNTPIWKKRNKLAELATHNIIIHLDDDDYYLPQSALAKVQLLNKYWGENIECVGTTMLGIYHILKNYSYLAQNVYISEASLAYNKKFWEDRPFQDKDLNMGEGYSFIHQRENKVLDMPYSFNLIALTHDNNYTKGLRTHERNDHQNYDNFFNLWDRDTQLFFLELRTKLKKQQKQSTQSK